MDGHVLQHAQLLIEVPVDAQKSYLENLQVQAHIFNTRNVPTKSFWKKIQINTDLKRVYLMKSIHRQLGEHISPSVQKCTKCFGTNSLVLSCCQGNRTQTTDISCLGMVECDQRICIKEYNPRCSRDMRSAKPI